MKFLKFYYDINPWEKPVASDSEMERRHIPAVKPGTVDSMLFWPMSRELYTWVDYW